MKYIIAIRKTKYGYDTHVPALPGCHSQGNTEKEAVKNTYRNFDLFGNGAKRIKKYQLQGNRGGLRLSFKMLFTDISSARAIKAFQKAGFWISATHGKSTRA